MADMAARDTIDRLLRSQDRLRESADRTSVAFYRLEQYAQRAALALARVGSVGQSKSGDSSNYKTHSGMALVPTIATNITANITAATASEPWEKTLDIVSKFAGIISAINDVFDLPKKFREAFPKWFKGNKTSNDDGKPPPPGGAGSRTRGSLSRRQPRNRTRGEDGGSSRSPFDKPLGERTRPDTPDNKSTAASRTADTEKKAPYKNNVVPFRRKSDSTSSSGTGVPEETLGDRTKPGTPSPNKVPGTSDKKETDLNDKTRPTTPQDSRSSSAEEGGSGTGSDASKSKSGKFGALKGLWQKGKGLFKSVGKSNVYTRTASGMLDIATADNKTAAIIGTIAGLGGAAIGTLAGSAILPGLGTVVGANVGGWIGEKTGNLVNGVMDWFGKKFKTPAAETSMPVNPAIVADPAANLSLYPESAPLPPPGPNSLTAPNPADLPAPTYNISVEGVQLNMPKEEIDEESLARKIGWEIVSKMKLAMDNRVAT